MTHDLPLLDAILTAYRPVIGADFVAYRQHCHRVAALCLASLDDSLSHAQHRAVQIAAAYHDLGIWTANTFDYLEPSVTLALAGEADLAGIDPKLVAAMIYWHHKITPMIMPGSGADQALVNAFRRADWFDVVCGLFARWSLSPSRRALYRRLPVAGFHGVLLRLALRRLRTHPLSPLPMFRW